MQCSELYRWMCSMQGSMGHFWELVQANILDEQFVRSRTPDSQEQSRETPIRISIYVTTEQETFKLMRYYYKLFLSYIDLYVYLIDRCEADIMIQKLSKLHQHQCIPSMQVGYICMNDNRYQSRAWKCLSTQRSKSWSGDC